MIRQMETKKIIVLILIVLLTCLLVYMLFFKENNDSRFKEIGHFNKQAEEIVNKMSLEEKIYQMMIVTPEQITGVETVTEAGKATASALQKYPVGGLIYSKRNINDRNQISKVIKKSQSYAKTGMFIVIDEEGSMSGLKPMFAYHTKGKKKASGNARDIAENIKSMGFNLDLAPVADVWSDSMNTDVSDHAYSDDFKEASELIPSAVNGFHRGGVLCTLKHFPGAGDLTEDLSTGKLYLTKKIEEIKEGEMIPFRSGIDAGADIIMTGHMIAEAIDQRLPASLSSDVIKETLRKEMGFEGLVMTESLSEDVITKYYSAGEAAVLAVKAGNDLLLKPESVSEAVSAIIEEVNTGGIAEAQISESATRVIEAKLRAGIIH